jgi:ribosomal-protein-alanine N-acetyltransferase
MGRDDSLVTRAIGSGELGHVRRILDTSEYTYARFAPDELPGLLARLPATGLFRQPSGRLARLTGGALIAFLLCNWLNPPSGWIGGFGVTWSEGAAFEDHLDALLPALLARLNDVGVTTAYYSGGDVASDWLRAALERRDFHLTTLLRSYDKEDMTIPTPGNREVRVRPFTPADVAGTLAVESLCFAPLWRHSAENFLEIHATYPYFVVAEDDSGIVGYQFNATDATTGYLVRIAVHPRAEGRGVGARLLAEAVRYFQRAHVLKIVLNTEEANTRAQALYERFGFHFVPPRGFVLARDLAPAR